MAANPNRPWRRLLAYLRPEPILTVDAFRAFVEERAAFVAQKCAIDYCRGKTGLASYALFSEKPFLDALDVCRWETFATVLGDLILLAEGFLRSHLTPEQEPRLRTALLELHSTVLASQPAPAHRADRGWNDVVAQFATRLKLASDAHAPATLDLADHSARRLFDTLPIHISMRELDEEVVYGAVRFRMIAINQEMQRRVRPDSLVVNLVA